MDNNLRGPRSFGELVGERMDRYKSLEDDPTFADHERRAKRVVAARDLNSRFIALTAYYRCAQREIADAPFEWAIDPRQLRWRELMTPIEQAVWEALQACGLKFYPQYPIGRYFVDFAHPAAKAVVECDGAAYHKDRAADALRQRKIEALGWTVFRITGIECLHERDDTEDDPSPLWTFVRRVRAFVDEQRERML